MYCSLTAEHSADWFDIQEQRRTAATKRLFYVRSFMATLYGRAVWGAERLAGSFARYVNSHGSAHPIDIGEAENLNRLQRSFTMAKSKGATALVTKSTFANLPAKPTSPIKNKTAGRGYRKLPFVAGSRTSATAEYWHIPATGGYFGGYETGEAMALALLKAMRNDEIDYDISFIAESFMVRFEEEGGRKILIDTPFNDLPESADSLRGQYCGFFNTLSTWLGAAARTHGPKLDRMTEKELVGRANAGLGFDNKKFLMEASA